MVRTPSIDKNGIIRGAWSEEEDNILKSFVLKHGHPNWRQLPRFAGLARCGKSCRLRWNNYLKPSIKRGNYTEEEVEKIIKLREELGNRWSLIASKLPGRTDNEIKNFWHTHLRKHTVQSQQSIISTNENSENLDQNLAIDSIEQVSTSQSIQIKEIDCNDVDSFSEKSLMNSDCTSFENLNSMDSFDFGGIQIDPFLFNTSNDHTTQSTSYDQMKEFDLTGADSFPEVSSMNYNSTSFENLNSMDSFDLGGIRYEPFLFNTSNDHTTQSTGYDQMKEFDSTGADSFPEVSSMNYSSTSFENLNSMDSFDLGGIRHEPILFNVSNDLTKQSTVNDQMKEFDSTGADSFPEVSSINYNSTSSENLNSMDSFDLGGIRHEPFLFNTSNDHTKHSTGDDQMKEFDSTGADSFPEVSSINYNSTHFENLGTMDSIQEDFGASNNQITQSFSCDSIQRYRIEHFLLDNSYSQSSPSSIFNSIHLDSYSQSSTSCNFSLQSEVEGTRNSSYESDPSFWTQFLSNDESYEEHANNFSSTTSYEEWMAPFMPLETSDDDLLNLLVNSFINSDEEHHNATMF